MKRGDNEVSILVILDVALRRSRIPEGQQRLGVSILVILDVALRLLYAGLTTATSPVSILVILDVALRHQDERVVRIHYEFQSLLSWMLL